MRDDPKPQEIYRHFKGGLYQVITLAKHAQTGEPLVIYQALYGDFAVYARALSEFLSETDHEKYPSAMQKYRFEKAGQQKTACSGLEAKAETEKQEDTKRETETSKTRLNTDLEDKVQIVKLRRTDQSEAMTGESEEAAAKQTDTAKQAKNLRTEETLQIEEALQTEETINIDPLVMEFLDADSYEERLNILAALHCRITDEMINTLSVAVDIEVNEGDIEERYEALKNCLVTLEKYECNRLR